MIKRIIDIETEAQRMIDDVEKEKIDRANELQERLKGLKIKLTQDAYNKVEAIRDKEIAAARALAVERATQCAGKIQNIQSYLDDNGEKWSEDLVKAVLKR